MWNYPTKIQLSKIPKLYSTENIPLNDKKIYMHFFIGGSDWYISEFDGDDTMFGYTILNGNTEMAEWGYISLSELKRIKQGFIQVDRDMHWKVKKVKDIPEIFRCGEYT